MIIPLPLSLQNFEQYYQQFGPAPKSAFCAISLIITKRFFEQTSTRPPSDAYLNQMLQSSWDLIHDEGLPKPLGDKEAGQAYDPDYNYHLSLVENILSQLPRHNSEDSLRVLLCQLLILTLAREFKTCRLSFLEEDSSGECARQSVDHCRDRISGSHCEDCPYFTALSSKQHNKLLLRSWVGETPPTAAELSILLPEDVRALRIFWHMYIRSVN